jgi:hypothetical protein
MNGQNIIISGTSNSGNIAISTWSQLTWNTTTIWSAATNVYEDRRILVMTGNTTLSITNLYNGWAGLLETIQSGNNAPSGYSLFLPANTKVMNGGSGAVYLTSGFGAFDIVGFQYDGTNLFANMANLFN